ncbi:hypothetical protein K0U27_02965 [archaeon]|nr:hypothetical protein [archaeon]
MAIHPSLSMSDSLPPAMTVRISFDYVDESETKRFDESLTIYMKYDTEITPLPENAWVIMPQEEPKHPIMSDEQQDVMLQYCETGMRHPDMAGIPQCIKNEPSCDPNSELVDGICVVIDGGCEPDINENTTWCGPSCDYLKIILSEPSAFLFAFGIPSLIAGIVIGIVIWRKRK